MSYQTQVQRHHTIALINQQKQNANPYFQVHDTLFISLQENSTRVGSSIASPTDQPKPCSNWYHGFYQATTVCQRVFRNWTSCVFQKWTAHA